MEHTDRNGNPKIVASGTFPLTCPTCVDLIVTDIAVISVTPKGLVLLETAPGWSAMDVQKQTEAELIVSSELKDIAL